MLKAYALVRDLARGGVRSRNSRRKPRMRAHGRGAAGPARPRGRGSLGDRPPSQRNHSRLEIFRPARRCRRREPLAPPPAHRAPPLVAASPCPHPCSRLLFEFAHGELRGANVPCGTTPGPPRAVLSTSRTASRDVWRAIARNLALPSRVRGTLSLRTIHRVLSRRARVGPGAPQGFHQCTMNRRVSRERNAWQWPCPARRSVGA
jgi:hypothetical protein